MIISFAVFADNNNSDKTMKKVETETTSAISSVEIKGNVIDKTSKETLAGAIVYVDGNKVYTDLDGGFRLNNLTPGKHTVKAELISYETSQMEVDLKENSNITIPMLQK